MTPHEEQAISDWNASLTEDLQLTLIRTEDPRTAQLKEFCRQLAAIADRIKIEENDGKETDLPGLRIDANLIYHAIPLGRELAPFLEAISLYHKKNIPTDEPLREELEAVSEPVLIKLFIAQQCPHCPLTVQQFTPLPRLNDNIQLIIIDGMLFTEEADANKILSVPTILQENKRWTGATNAQEVIDVLLEKKTDELSPSSLIKILEEGKAEELAGKMIAQGKIFESFLDLLVHKQWSIRLGAIVSAETIIEKDQALADQLVSQLWKRYPSVDDTAKGDLIYIFGEAGDTAMIERLNALLDSESNTDVQDAVQEAINSINERHGNPE